MGKIEVLVQDFLEQKKIAVVGVSDKRDTVCNLNYKKFKENGYLVYSVNPRINEFDGSPCYPDLRSLPEKPDGVFILASPRITEQIVEQCVELGIRRIWMHCMMGTKPGLAGKITSVSESAVEICNQNGIAVIPGTCPAQFLKPDFGHGLMRRLWKLLGFLK
jgi:uncharacterized protein